MSDEVKEQEKQETKQLLALAKILQSVLKDKRYTRFKSAAGEIIEEYTLRLVRLAEDDINKFYLKATKLQG